MATIRKRGSRWYVQPWNRKLKKDEAEEPLPPSIKNKRDARKAAAEIQENLDRTLLGLPIRSPKNSKNTFAEAAGPVLAETRISTTRDTYSGAQMHVKRFLDRAGDKPMGFYTTEICRAFQSGELSAGANPSTLRKRVTYISRVFERAFEEGLIEKNPWKAIKRPTETPAQPRFLIALELERLIEAAPDLRKFRYAFLAGTGARRGEALRVRWDDVDLARREVKIPNSRKGGEPTKQFRMVPIFDPLYPVLRAHRGDADGRLFETGNNWRRDILLDAGRAGLRAVRIHDLRHCFGSHLAQTGRVSLQQIRDWMGHASITTTEIYAHLLPSDNRAVAQLLGDYREGVVKKGHTAKIVEVQ